MTDFLSPEPRAGVLKRPSIPDVVDVTRTVLGRVEAESGAANHPQCCSRGEFRIHRLKKGVQLDRRELTQA